MTHGSLFSGIGGFDLGFERAGIKTVWQVEIDPFCRKILERHWPNVQRFNDIKECRELPKVDIISGGFPCQPFSRAGSRQGKDDNRYLWPEMLRVIALVRPAFVVAENVYGFLSMQDGAILSEVYASLESEGYETLPPLVVPACAFGARHRRDRVWIIAHSVCTRFENGRPESNTSVGGGSQIGKAPANERAKTEKSNPLYRDPGAGRYGPPEAEICASRDGAECADAWSSEPELDRVAHGIPYRVDRLRGLGNSIVPQIAQWIGDRIVKCGSRLSR